MPLSRYPDPPPSPHLYPSPRDAKHPEHRKRKASLPQSLHRFAKHTFLRRPRHTTTDYSSVRTTPATSLTSGSCPASPAVPPSRSDGAMASGECPLGGSAVASGGRTRVQPPMTTTASSNGGGTMPRKAGSKQLLQPTLANPCISYYEVSNPAQTKEGKQETSNSGNEKSKNAPGEVPQTRLPSPQKRRYTYSNLPLPKSTTFSSFSARRQGSSIPRSQSRPKDIKGLCGQQANEQQQPMGSMSQKQRTTQTAPQTANKNNNTNPSGFGPRHCFTPHHQQPPLFQHASSLPKSQTAINLTSYSSSTTPNPPAPTESFINRFRNQNQPIRSSKRSRSPAYCGDDAAAVPPVPALNRNVYTVKAPQLGSLKGQASMELIFPCPSSTDSVEDIQTISTAQPQQYWLGRFSTLVNAFHQEDAFKTKSDSITINYTISSPHPHPHASPYPSPSSPKQQPTHYIATSPTATLDDQRAKRAFIFLENACTTSEARKSFLEFRDVYTKRFGDRWTNWFVVEGHHGNGSTSDLSSGTLVSSLGNGEKGKIRKSSENGILGVGSGGGGIGLMNMFRTVRRSLV
ncbi:hypothetical protein FQN51_003466 [Onygenales sp. PD_10]|nr:hypothetical protein FQN51_003466 [Onygenales sp. PD_10]